MQFIDPLDTPGFIRHATTLLTSQQPDLDAIKSILIALAAGSDLSAEFLIDSSASPLAPEDATGQQIKETEAYQVGQRVFAQENNGLEARSAIVAALVNATSTAVASSSTTTLARPLLVYLVFLHAHLLTTDQEFEQAAKVLASVPLDPTLADKTKLDVHIHTARLFLEADESGLAHSSLNRAGNLVHLLDPRLPQDRPTWLAYKLCQARLFDFQRKFHEAAYKYHQLSFEPDIDQDERMLMLSAAITTAILSPAGPQRSRLLVTLYRDDRHATQLAPHLAVILSKMVLDQVLRPHELAEFEAGLAEHQSVSLDNKNGGPKSILDRAVMEHNTLACARVYDNIHFDSLAALLGTTSASAEQMVQTMISQSRLSASIDQPSGYIHFTPGQSRVGGLDDQQLTGTAGGLDAGEKAPGQDESNGDESSNRLTGRNGLKGSWVDTWDDRIKRLADQVESLNLMIKQRDLLVAGGDPSMAVDS